MCLFSIWNLYRCEKKKNICLPMQYAKRHHLFFFIIISFFMENVNNCNPSVYIVYIKLDPTLSCNGSQCMKENTLRFVRAFCLILMGEVNLLNYNKALDWWSMSRDVNWVFKGDGLLLCRATTTYGSTTTTYDSMNS